MTEDKLISNQSDVRLLSNIIENEEVNYGVNSGSYSNSKNGGALNHKITNGNKQLASNIPKSPSYNDHSRDSHNNFFIDSLNNKDNNFKDVYDQNYSPNQ